MKRFAIPLLFTMVLTGCLNNNEARNQIEKYPQREDGYTKIQKTVQQADYERWQKRVERDMDNKH